jgi:hypothetical protein
MVQMYRARMVSATQMPVLVLPDPVLVTVYAALPAIDPLTESIHAIRSGQTVVMTGADLDQFHYALHAKWCLPADPAERARLRNSMAWFSSVLFGVSRGDRVALRAWDATKDGEPPTPGSTPHDGDTDDTDTATSSKRNRT